MPLALKAQSPKHWIARKLLFFLLTLIITLIRGINKGFWDSSSKSKFVIFMLVQMILWKE